MKSDMEALIEDLRAYTSDDVANPWREQDETELDLPGAAALRRDYLRRYLAVRPAPRVLLLAEAAGYQGCRFSGIALTCERMLLGHHKRVGPQDIFLTPETVERTSRVTDGMPNTRARLGYNEPTDTMVWQAALDAGLRPESFLLWNIFPFHPHPATNPLANRTPQEAELAAGLTFARRIIDMYRPPLIFAIGRKAQQMLAQGGIPSVALRHPANGGATEFRRGFQQAIQ